MRRKENAWQLRNWQKQTRSRSLLLLKLRRKKDRLHGVGIAEQRKAIVDGLADSIKELKGANVDLTEEQIMSILLTNQYLDTLNNFADKEGNNTIFLPANPDGVENIRTQILSALKAK